ncbi:MAG: hypothetical protein ACKO2P_19670 [Planctomycetota bacterium]
MSQTPLPKPSTPTTLGTPRIGVNQLDMGGWLRVYLGQGDPSGEVACYLSHALNGWFRERPHLRLRFVLPVTRHGHTVELHAWYEQVWFSDQSPLARATPRTPATSTTPPASSITPSPTSPR